MILGSLRPGSVKCRRQTYDNAEWCVAHGSPFHRRAQRCEKSRRLPDAVVARSKPARIGVYHDRRFGYFKAYDTYDGWSYAVWIGPICIEWGDNV